MTEEDKIEYSDADCLVLLDYYANTCESLMTQEDRFSMRVHSLLLRNLSNAVNLTAFAHSESFKNLADTEIELFKTQVLKLGDLITRLREHAQMPVFEAYQIMPTPSLKYVC